MRLVRGRCAASAWPQRGPGAASRSAGGLPAGGVVWRQAGAGGKGPAPCVVERGRELGLRPSASGTGTVPERSPSRDELSSVERSPSKARAQNFTRKIK